MKLRLFLLLSHLFDKIERKARILILSIQPRKPIAVFAILRISYLVFSECKVGDPDASSKYFDLDIKDILI